MFKPFEITRIEYTRKDHTNGGKRTIIPTFIPTQAMKAVDVTGLSEEEQKEVLSLLKEYSAYYEAAMQRVFSFEDWLTHTTGMSESSLPEVKWRTFLLDSTKAIK